MKHRAAQRKVKQGQWNLYLVNGKVQACYTLGFVPVGSSVWIGTEMRTAPCKLWLVQLSNGFKQYATERSLLPIDSSSLSVAEKRKYIELNQRCSF